MHADATDDSTGNVHKAGRDCKRPVLRLEDLNHFVHQNQLAQEPDTIASQRGESVVRKAAAVPGPAHQCERGVLNY